MTPETLNLDGRVGLTWKSSINKACFQPRFAMRHHVGLYDWFIALKTPICVFVIPVYMLIVLVFLNK